MPTGPAQGVVQRADGRYLVLRPPLTQRLVVATLLAALGALLTLGGGDRMPLAMSLPSCALIGLSAWRASRMRVELGPTVRITNFFRTLVMSWDVIEAFEYRSAEEVALVVRHDGGQHRITAFSPGFRSLSSIRQNASDAVRQMENRRTSRLHNRRGRPGRRSAP
jgi:hypothetical protein